jgi:hypothetical protein
MYSIGAGMSIESVVEQPNLVLYFRICYWHAANPLNFFNCQASQSNYGACFSAAGETAEFMYCAFSHVKMLQFNST